MTKTYSNGEVKVIWKPDVCIHSENCFKGLPDVFNPNNRPWINAEGAQTQTIVDQIKKCPSGALSFEMEGASSEEADPIKETQMAEVIENGPLRVHGTIEVKFPNGEVHTKHKVTAFCRCGASSNKPFCDGTHKKTDFRG